MLVSLYIRNFALIQELTVSFNPGLTIITGETGAGKSILVGALSLVLGERSSSDLVRSGTSKAVIEAILNDVHSEKIERLLHDANIETAQELILRRELSSTGQSRCFINDTPCTAAILKQTGEMLIDLHGQHDHQLLLHADTHESLLDDFAKTAQEVTAYKEARSALQEMQRGLETLKKEAAEIREKREIVTFQLNELNALDLKSGEEESIETEITLLENAETLFTLSASLSELLYDSEHSLYSAISEALHLLEKLATIDRRFDIHLEESRSAQSIVDELARFTRSYTANIDFNPVRLESLRERQLQLQRIGKKYGRSLSGLIELKNELEAKSALEENLEEEVDRIRQQIARQKAELSRYADTLCRKRQDAAHRLELLIQKQLAELGIPHATFVVSMRHEENREGEITVDGKCYTAFAGGYDQIEFLISANPGEKPKPLVKVASGGEISRVMLALKSALAESAELPILIFDEIDTGISGRIAEAVGRSLKNLSRLHQIIAITHLPQIAAMADLHLSVQKSVQQERTITEVTVLDHESRLQAIAALISGKNISPSSLTLAAELVERAAR
ncbi:DNA repair protein RecN [Pelodictyon phaeoclathratiforme]|uniref:DNA repair protein RecN n=1 Tax=Pelodictyon phaeoclathratiforme (strain DSM 5477 / BU-1) TaxID=324925 RepID=B4SE05_PELPB|nr:DNA repair protein RecN [Pelodictyon phaeoclathratiforme]ACF42996.1 DNA repair protein RecN [Pelodictyon phaeoclathratiforme BU-1]MBV5289704.1 DNA repair protein RecN [Pelodictyon phaeoclathratiforme]